MFRGNQWEGVIANGLSTPVFNIFKRVINYKIASIMSQKVKMIFSPEGIETGTNPDLESVSELLSKYSETKWEKLKMDMLLLREGLLDGALSGDICAYTYWDDTIDTRQKIGGVPIMGDFTTELVDNVNVYFGNPNNRKVKGQPYILIEGRGLVSDLREEAKRNKVSQFDIDNITSDVDNTEQSGDHGHIELDNKDDNGKCTYLIKLRMNPDTKTIWMNKSTKLVTIKKDVDTKLKCYPIAWMNWDSVKNSYHGQAEGTGLVDNQRSINKMFAMVIYWLQFMAFGKVAYDATKISNYSNALGVAIPVNGNVAGVIQQLAPGQINQVILEVIDKAINYTKEFMGVTDTALGNSNPDNFRALIANQQQAAIPLENVKANLYQFVEDIGLIWLEFMLTKYNVPRQLSYKEKDMTKVKEFDGSQYQDQGFNIKIDVGPSSYWSETASITTLDNLLKAGKITDVQYYERLPDGYIVDKQGIIDELKQQAEQQAQMMAQQSQAGDQVKQLQYEKMAQFVESLPEDIQAKLKAMPDAQMEEAVMQLMMQQGGGQNGQESNIQSNA